MKTLIKILLLALSLNTFANADVTSKLERTIQRINSLERSLSDLSYEASLVKSEIRQVIYDLGRADEELVTCSYTQSRTVLIGKGVDEKAARRELMKKCVALGVNSSACTANIRYLAQCY